MEAAAAAAALASSVITHTSPLASSDQHHHTAYLKYGDKVNAYLLVFGTGNRNLTFKGQHVKSQTNH